MPRGPVPRVDRTCEVCGAIFQVRVTDLARPKRKARFCSQACHFKTINTPERNARISRETADKRSASARAKSKGPKGYETVQGGRHKHLVIAEQKLGRALLPGEVVHHKNSNHHDNRPENIQVLPSQAEHARLHALERRKA